MKPDATRTFDLAYAQRNWFRHKQFPKRSKCICPACGALAVAQFEAIPKTNPLQMRWYWECEDGHAVLMGIHTYKDAGK